MFRQVAAFAFMVLYFVHFINAIPQAATEPYDITADETVVYDGLSYGSKVISILEDYVTNKLPPTAAAEGKQIVDESRLGIQYCEREFYRNLEIWQYKVCCSGQLRLGMSGLNTLSGQYWSSYTSGATRLHSSLLKSVLCLFGF